MFRNLLIERNWPAPRKKSFDREEGAGWTQVLHYSRSFGSLPWLYVLVVMLKPLIATSLYERCIKTFWIHSKLMALAFCGILFFKLPSLRSIKPFVQSEKERGHTLSDWEKYPPLKVLSENLSVCWHSFNREFSLIGHLVLCCWGGCRAQVFQQIGVSILGRVPMYRLCVYRADGKFKSAFITGWNK